MESKRDVFLGFLNKYLKRLVSFDKYFGPGIKRKIQRLFWGYRFYIPYLYRKIISSKTKTELFWGRVVKIPKGHKPSFFALGGILPGEAEYKLTIFFIKNIKEEDVFYDIGANYGFYTFLALEFCKEVHSFEPLPDVHSVLKENLQNNQQVHLNNLALSNNIGNAQLLISDASSTIVDEAKDILKETGSGDKEVRVETTTLDKYLENNEAPTVIKMDVEGAEFLVIEGGREFFKKNSPIISMEIWPENMGGEISMKAVNQLRDLNYQSYSIDLNGKIEKMDGNLSEIVLKNNLPNDNFIFKKVEKK